MLLDNNLEKNTDLYDYYLEKKLAGMDFSQIRKELSSRNIPEDEIKDIINFVDSKFIQFHNKKTQRFQFNNRVVFGLIIFSIGALITIGTYTNAISFGGRYIFAYGPMIWGAMLMMVGASSKEKQQRSFRKR